MYADIYAIQVHFQKFSRTNNNLMVGRSLDTPAIDNANSVFFTFTISVQGRASPGKVSWRKSSGHSEDLSEVPHKPKNWGGRVEAEH